MTDSVYTFDNITVTTYQRLYNELKKIKMSGRTSVSSILFGNHYDVICCDEIHMIQDDVLFSQAANEILDDIFDFFKQEVTYLFFSATMNTIERVLYDKICTKLLSYSVSIYHGHRPDRIMERQLPFIRKFVMENTYENYYVAYMKKMDEIKELYDSLSDYQKLLVFVSSKQEGRELQSMLQDSVFIFADNGIEHLDNKSSKEYKNIVHNERFDCKCLIATKVLDAGVNLNMEDLSDIVIATEDGESEFVQIVGRKRNPNDSQVRLYIMSRDVRYFNSKRQQYIEKLQALSAIHLCESCKKYNRCTFCNSCEHAVFQTIQLGTLQGITKLEGTTIQVNEMAEKRLKIMADYYDALVKEFDEFGNSAFIKKQLSWLGLESQYDDANYYKKKNIPKSTEDLVKYLDSKIGCKLNAELKEEFRKRFEEIVIGMNCYKVDKRNNIGRCKINNILESNNIPFIVQSKTYKSVTIWEVYRHEWINTEDGGTKYETN